MSKEKVKLENNIVLVLNSSSINLTSKSLIFFGQQQAKA
jgi:hypothetical protein